MGTLHQFIRDMEDESMVSMERTQKKEIACIFGGFD
jgi:hypothetical protein